MNMKKIIIRLIVVLILAGCRSPQPSLVFQIDHLSESIVKKKKLLVQRVEETGSTQLGNSLLEISDKLTNQTDFLIEQIRNDSLPKIEKINEITNIYYPKLLQLRIERNDQFLYESYEEFVDKNNSELFILSLLMYNEHVIRNMIDFHIGGFQCFDNLNPMVLSDGNEIKQGEVFEGLALTEARLIHFPFIYEIDDPQTDEGFVRIPSNTDNFPGGLIRIVGTKVGTHKIKVRSTIRRNGEDDTYPSEFTLKVIE